MIFKYHTFEIVPWGAILDIDCTSSSKKVGRVTNWISTNNYQTEYGYLGTDRSYFVESKAEPMSMTYSCTSKNGDLVDIQTNLSCTTSKNSSGIITSFTIDNTNWFNTAYTTESIQIQKVIKKVKITLNNTPYTINSDYLKFYVNDSSVSYASYENNTFYFNTQNTSPIIAENTNIKSIYNIINEIEEKNLTTVRYNNLYDQVFVSKGCFEIPKKIYNVSKQVDITNSYYTYNYDSTEKKSYFLIRRGTNLESGDTVNINYRYYERAQETINTTQYSSSYGKGFVNKKPIGSTSYVLAINTSRSNATVTIYTYGYDSNEGKYYFLFRVNSNYQIGDRINITYYYLNEVEETKKALEAENYTLHQGTITQYPNLTVEDYLDSNGNFVSCKRNGNIISLSTNTYDNKEIIVRYEKEKPYVKLCCNNVKIETVFLNSGGGYSNDFRSLTWDNTYLYPTGTASVSNIKGKLLRYITVHWNKTQSQRVYFGESFINTSLGHNSSHYMFLGGSDSYSKLGDGVHEHNTTTYSITTPAINSLSKPYYSVGYVVNFQGESWTPGSSRYINSPFTYYTNDGYIKSVTTGTEYDISGMPIPTVTKLEKWGDQSSFYVSNNYYVSPSDGLQLYTKWSSCGDYDPPCYEGCGEGCGQCGEGSGQVYAQNRYNGGATGDIAAQDSSGNYYRTGDMVFVSSGWYNVLGYCSGNPVISGPIVLNYYSWDGSDY